MTSEPLESALLRGDPISIALEVLWDRFRDERSGSVATYIPELANVDPDLFGLALVSVDGSIYRAGDADLPFTIQSISKPFTYALAVATLGCDAVLDAVGAEPSGEAFNAISLDRATGKPANPMINAGAILTASLIPATSPDDRFEQIRKTLSRFAGRTLDVDGSVYRSERASGDRNRALAYLMRSAGALRGDVDNALEVYFKQCSLLVTAVDLAIMAATLANGGTNPVTGDEVIPELVAEQTMAIMATCGMYDYAGEWLLRVGLPAKSGVAGGLAAVSPSQFGIGTFSPRLDDRGTSVRGDLVCRSLSSEFSLHFLHRPARSVPMLFVEHPDIAPSVANTPTVIGIQGDLEFTAAERLLRGLDPLRASFEESAQHKVLILDLERVTSAHPVAVSLLNAVCRALAPIDVSVLVVDPSGRHLIEEATGNYDSVEAALKAAAAS